MNKCTTFVAILLFTCNSLFAQTAAPAPTTAPTSTLANAPPPERIVQNNVVISKRDPALKISVPKNATYIGAARWNLFDVADCELHVFVEADSERRVKKYYWIHFEGYLPSQPNFVYEHKGGAQQMVYGLDMNVRARFGPTAEPQKAGSDSERVMKMITGAGYTLPAHIINVRFIHLLDASKRRELMVIYTEDMAPTGFTSNDLIKDNKIDAEKWAVIEAPLIQRALTNVKIFR
jgi:hypothetical protein